MRMSEIEMNSNEIKNLIVQLIFVFRIITVYHLLLINIKLKQMKNQWNVMSWFVELAENFIIN